MTNEEVVENIEEEQSSIQKLKEKFKRGVDASKEILRNKVDTVKDEISGFGERTRNVQKGLQKDLKDSFHKKKDVIIQENYVRIQKPNEFQNGLVGTQRPLTLYEQRILSEQRFKEDTRQKYLHALPRGVLTPSLHSEGDEYRQSTAYRPQFYQPQMVFSNLNLSSGLWNSEVRQKNQNLNLSITQSPFSNLWRVKKKKKKNHQ